MNAPNFFELAFSNSDATPKLSVVHVSVASVSAVMAWYGSYYAGDRYSVTANGRKLEKDHNGELVGAVIAQDGQS